VEQAGLVRVGGDFIEEGLGSAGYGVTPGCTVDATGYEGRGMGSRTRWAGWF
jgi:hypothetical protein